VHWILQAPILAKFWNWSCLEVECEQLSEFLYAKRADSHCDELKLTMGEFPVCLVDLSQGAVMAYVSSSVSGKSASACRIRAGMQPQI
jgi:hypothetical protein